MNFEMIADILQIILADIILSPDNALIIGMAVGMSAHHADYSASPDRGAGQA